MLTPEIASKLMPLEAPPITLPPSDRQGRLADLSDFPSEHAEVMTRCVPWLDAIEAALPDDMRTDKNTHELAMGFVRLPPALMGHEDIRTARKDTEYIFGAVRFDLSFKSPLEMRVSPLGAFNSDLDGLHMLHMPAAQELHGLPQLPSARATCFATVNAQDAILTAAHAVAWNPPGAAFNMPNGDVATVIDVTQNPVDGALLELRSQPSSQSGMPMAVQNVPLPMEPVEFTSQGTKVSTTLSMVQVISGVYDPAFPQRVFLDQGGMQTDSGALVRSSRSGEAVGLYTGQLNAPGQSYPYAQALFQLTELLNCTLLED